MPKIPDRFYAHFKDQPVKIAWCRIYDNGGKTYDRYTAVFMDRPQRATVGQLVMPLYESLGFSDNPFHPQGIGQHTSALPGKNLGKRIAFESLNADCKQFIKQNL